MKSNKFFTVLLAIVASIALVSCVQDDDFSIPNSLGDEENKSLQALLNSSATSMTISELKDQFVPGAATEIVSDVYVKGYVSSSDATGNFYKEFFIQDHPTNPTAGLKVVLNQVDSYNQFNFGREVYIKLKGLYIGETRSGDDVIGIGGAPNAEGDEIEEMTANQIPMHVFRSEITETIAPKVVKFSQIDDSHVGLYVMVENVHFQPGLQGESYVDELDDFDTSRTMQSCEGFDFVTFPLETSSFANFKNVILPTGTGGSISAVVNKTYNGSNAVLVLNKLEDVNFTDSLCQPLDINDFNAIFEEDMQSSTNYEDFNVTDWTNFAEAGSRVWRERVFSGNGYAELSSYQSGDDSNIAWLITPGIDMDAQENEFLNFKSAQHHLDSPDNTLEVFVSTDYDGSNVAGATWIAVEANLAGQSNSWYQFQDSGLIDISSYTGTLYVAFKYTGSGTNTQLDGAYMIDDVRVLASN